MWRHVATYFRSFRFSFLSSWNLLVFDTWTRLHSRVTLTMRRRLLTDHDRHRLALVRTHVRENVVYTFDPVRTGKPATSGLARFNSRARQLMHRITSSIRNSHSKAIHSDFYFKFSNRRHRIFPHKIWVQKLILIKLASNNVNISWKRNYILCYNYRMKTRTWICIARDICIFNFLRRIKIPGIFKLAWNCKV